MLKTALFYLMLAFTGIRLADLLYLLFRDTANLPATVFVVAGVMVLYGVVLMVKRFVLSIRMKELLAFYLTHAASIVFNLTYVSIVCPLQLSFAEILLVGTFLDLIVDVCVIHYCVKQMRRPANIVSRMVREGKLHV